MNFEALMACCSRFCLTLRKVSVLIMVLMLTTVDIFLGSIIDLVLELDFLPLFATLLLQFYKTHSCDAT